MTNETFGMTTQYAICEHFNIAHTIPVDRTDECLLELLNSSNKVEKIFEGLAKPAEYLTFSKRYTSDYVKRCPHTFLLENGQTFSIKTFGNKNKMFAPHVVGQSGNNTFNYFFGDLSDKPINRKNFKQFCLSKINKMLPIIVDWALISDYTCLLYLKDNEVCYDIFERGDLPDITYELKDFSFTKRSVETWNESTTVKFKGDAILELQLHTNKSGYKIRINRKNFFKLLEKKRKEINNSTLGDTAERAICDVFGLEIGKNSRLINNSDEYLLEVFVTHYTNNKKRLFPLFPIKYAGTEKRARGGCSKSGADFYLEKDKTLSVKTNKAVSYKVCPPEIGQPSHKTFDLHFSQKGWYSGGINEAKFRKLVLDKYVVTQLLSEYVKFLNECHYLLWSCCLDDKDIISYIIHKEELTGIKFDPDLITYSNDFTDKNSVTLYYVINKRRVPLGEFQIHSARASLKFRFNLGNLLKLR